MAEWLYRYEVKGIQAFILATGKLREISGASQLVDGLAKEVRDVVGEHGDVVMAAAGGAVIRFRDDAGLKAFAEAWPRYVAGKLPGVELVQAWVGLGGVTEPVAMATLFERLGHARQYRHALPEVAPLVLRAGRTGRPAVERATSRDDRGALLDAGSIRKQGVCGDALGDRIDGRKYVRDADRFTETYVGVVHIDGNDLGRRVERVSKRGLEAYREFAKRLNECTEAAAREAFKEIEASQGEVRARPIVLGGDDLTAIVEAKDAIKFTETFIRAFERETDANKEWLDGEKVTVCAGIAFVKPDAPYVQAHELAEALCKDAKQRSRREGQPTPSGVLFHRVTTSYIDDWHAIRRDELADAALVFGPYRLDGAPSLRAISEAARLPDLPRGGLREWVGLVSEGETGGTERLLRAEKHWNRLETVAASKGGSWDELRKRLGELTGGSGPWRESTPRATPIHDLLTLRVVDARTKAES